MTLDLRRLRDIAQREPQGISAGEIREVFQALSTISDELLASYESKKAPDTDDGPPDRKRKRNE